MSASTPFDEADVPPVTPGTKVTIQLKSANYRHTVDGVEVEVFVKADATSMVIHSNEDCWNDTWADYADTPSGAAHMVTICTDCIASWAIDHYITIDEVQS